VRALLRRFRVVLGTSGHGQWLRRGVDSGMVPRVMRSGMRILVAEDDATSRSLLAALLGRWGYAVEAVEDGVLALERLRQPDPPRLAILDWVMPRMDGTEVCRQIRQPGGPALLYVVLLTARGEKSEIIRGLQAGANDYVTKPYDPEELRARIGVGQRMIELQEALAARLRELEEAQAHIKTLQGILPICMHCHKIRTDQQGWEQLEHYISQHSEAQFSHSICPECIQKHFPQYAPPRSQNAS